MRRRRALVVVELLAIYSGYIVLIDAAFRAAFGHSMWLRRCLLGEPWHQWTPLLASSIGLFGLALLGTWVARAQTRTLRIVLLIPVMLYSAWVGLWGLGGVVLGIDNQRQLATPGLIPTIQGAATVLVQFMQERWSAKLRVIVLFGLILALPAIWILANYMLGTEVCR